MQIDYVRYDLRQKSTLNRMDLSNVREGALIRLNAGAGGYGCLHTWQELGDPSLDECLNTLRVGGTNRIIAQALACAQSMAELGPSPKRPTVRSHATLPRLTGTAVTEAVAAGFSTVKVKRGRDWMRLRKKTTSFIEAFPQLHWRFDFNGALTSHRELHQFLGTLPTRNIDFIEDPFTDPELAERWIGVPLAHDRVIPGELKLEQNYLIAKPAIQSLDMINDLAGEHPDRVIFTTYMDHPLGQVWAQAQAAQFYQEHGVSTPELGGLVTHGLFEPTAYDQVLGSPSPDTGWPDWTDLQQQLEQEPWMPLNF